MFQAIKKRLFFVVATYFAFWAKLVLRRWQPRIMVITGSSGKTTTLHLVEAQLGDKASYSHHANSSFGIPFDILGLHQVEGSKLRWLYLIIIAPFKIFRKVPAQKIYIVEADCDRPHEGAFLAKLLKPEVTLWVSSYHTHSMNFDKLVSNGQFADHSEAIAYEFGHFAAASSKFVAANKDVPEIVTQLKRVKSKVKLVKVSLEDLTDYQVSKTATTYRFKSGQDVKLPGFHPKEIAVNLELTQALVDYLKLPLDSDYQKFELPPGRGTVLKAQKDITIIDSTYNTGLKPTQAAISMLDKYPGEHKWLVLGDILEQGSLEKDEHEKLATVISKSKAEHVVLLGPRTKAYTLPLLKEKTKLAVVSFESPRDVLDYLRYNLKGGEILLFKGGRFLEGVIEQLLANPEDANKLVRRSREWTKRRQKWGLPK